MRCAVPLSMRSALLRRKDIMRCARDGLSVCLTLQAVSMMPVPPCHAMGACNVLRRLLAS